MRFLSAIIVLFLSVPFGFAAGRVAQFYGSPSRMERATLIIASVIGTAWVLLTVSPLWLVLVTCALGWSLLVLGMIDALVFRLPDALTFPLIITGLIVSYFLPDNDFAGHAIGAVILFMLFVGVMFGFERIRKREGLGLGDAKLAAAAGAWLGWEALPYILLISCAAGFVWVGIAAVRNGKVAFQRHIPFGIPLCLSIWILWLYGVPNLAL